MAAAAAAANKRASDKKYCCTRNMYGVYHTQITTTNPTQWQLVHIYSRYRIDLLKYTCALHTLTHSGAYVCIVGHNFIIDIYLYIYI